MEKSTHLCPNCEAHLTSDPKREKFYCEYCLGIFSIDQEKKIMKNGKSPENKSTNMMFVEEEDEPVELFNCQNCGSEIFMKSLISTNYCYYCHGSLVFSKRSSRTSLPEKILPFVIEKEVAMRAFSARKKKLWFAPKDFLNRQQIDKIVGVYIPYWLVEATVNGEINAKGTGYKGNNKHKKNGRFNINRVVQISFKNVIRNALSKDAKYKIGESVHPFLLDEVIPFKSQYLNGFQAAKSDIEYEKIRHTVDNELKPYTKQLLIDSVKDYTSLSKVKTTSAAKEQQNYCVLLPIWIVTYHRYAKSKKVYYYAMNGQTGKANGFFPIDYRRFFLFSFGIFFLLLFIFLLGGDFT